MKKAMALAFAVTFSLVGAAVAQDKAAGEAKGTVRSVEVSKQAVILEDGTRLSVSDNQIDHIWAGDQVKAGYQVKGDQNVVTDLQIERFSAQESD
jgi:hypothetical protein